MVSRLVALLSLAGCDAVFLDRSPIEDCPLEYTSVGKQPTRYRFVDKTELWTFAHADCIDDSDGLTHLAVLDRALEIDDIHSLAPTVTLLWVGYARDLVVAGDPKDYFEDVFGQPLPQRSSLWNNGEPSDSPPGEPVVQINNNGLNDDNLTTEKRYVCECSGKRPTRVFDLGQ